ncbi:MAG TPA: flagellar basal-body rod protein FlgF [Candidatus Sumerlaeota bacterium]|nr:flagellar basal-body rod protein FlgF [Candidatus Sumerlaeota bacterium]HOR28765.1 flagellar basal-body rod protein FlgF [Candidatus Sumerlaeota bacterium]HPK01666.1 flagellar basal-body rod protein FlgF [Candidatus Sumerlaeota bacterium]
MKEIHLTIAAATGQERALDRIANNLANVSTPGFKKDRAVFLNYLAGGALQAGLTAPSGGADPAKSAAAWPTAGTAFTDLSAGPIQHTQQPLDLAIEGDGYFMVEVEGQQAPRYTRAGNFRLNAAGELTTAAGRRILGDSGEPITIDPGLGAPEITETGEIFVGGQQVGRLGMVSFSDPSVLRKWGEGLLMAPPGVEPGESTGRIRQGYLEGSNVNPIEEMVRMIQAQRIYETQQKALQTADELTEQRIRAARE